MIKRTSKVQRNFERFARIATSYGLALVEVAELARIDAQLSRLQLPSATERSSVMRLPASRTTIPALTAGESVALGTWKPQQSSGLTPLSPVTPSWLGITSVILADAKYISITKPILRRLALASTVSIPQLQLPFIATRSLNNCQPRR